VLTHMGASNMRCAIKPESALSPSGGHRHTAELGEVVQGGESALGEWRSCLSPLHPGLLLFGEADSAMVWQPITQAQTRCGLLRGASARITVINRLMAACRSVSTHIRVGFCCVRVGFFREWYTETRPSREYVARHQINTPRY